MKRLPTRLMVLKCFDMVERFKNNNAVLVALERILSEDMGAISGIYEVTLRNATSKETVVVIGRLSDIRSLVPLDSIDYPCVQAIDFDQLLDLQHDTMFVNLNKPV